MLNKLMKYELNATSRLLVPLYLILLILSVINRFLFNLNNQEGILKIINGFFVVSYIILIFVVLVVTVIYMIIRFYKNLLTDEGYLMFTLPIKTHQLITSKLIITVFWSIVSIIAILVSLFIAFATPNSYPTITNAIKEALASINRDFGTSGGVMIFEFILMCLLSLVANILLIYISIACGQLFSKHKIIGSFASYMIIYTVIQFLLIILLAIFGAFGPQNSVGISAVTQEIFPIAIVILIIACTCFYLGTNYIFKRKLNLD